MSTGLGVKLKVSPQAYYSAATELHQLGVDLYIAVDGAYHGLMQGQMAGTYDEARKWAHDYDEHSRQCLVLVHGLCVSLDSYSAVVRKLGYVHETREWAAAGSRGPEPGEPPAPFPAEMTCHVPLPSAGGPANGLDDAIGLAQRVGITVPNGDVGKLASVGDAWTRLASDLAGLAGRVDTVSGHLEDLQAPELQTVHQDLAQFKNALTAVPEVCTTLGRECHTHADDLRHLREETLKHLLDELIEAIKEEIEIDLALFIGASIITLGAGTGVAAAGASAKLAAAVARFARPVRAAIEAWKMGSTAMRGIGHVGRDVKKLTDDMAALTRRLNTKAGAKPPAPAPKPHSHGPHASGDATSAAGKALSAEERRALFRYTGTDAKELNKALYSGRVTEEQAARIANINKGLDKLPDHQGVVTRRVPLHPDRLARYQEGREVTESGFISSSRTPPAAFDHPVEMQILSKHGKSVEHLAMVREEQEVLFRSGTTFDVVKRFTDPATGRLIIRMIER